MNEKCFADELPCIDCFNEPSGVVERHRRSAGRAGLQSQISFARLVPNKLDGWWELAVCGINRECSAVLRGIQLGEGAGAPLTFFDLGVQMEHPCRSIFCRDNKLDRPIAIFKAQISDGPHTARAVGDANLSTGLLFGH